MSRLRNTILTDRGMLRADDPSITIDDLRTSYFGGKVPRIGVTKCLGIRADLMKVVMDYSKENDLQNDSRRQAIVNFFNGIKTKPVCELCGKPTRFNHTLGQYARFCSHKCQNNSPDVKRVHKETNMRVYGVDNAAKSQVAKNKMKNTLLEKYGATCYLATEEGKDKARKTCLEHYGVDHVGKSQEFKEKRQATMLRKYGVKNALQNPEIMKRRDATCMERFGELYPGTYRLKELAAETRLKVWDSLPDIFPDYELLCGRDEFMGVYEHENTWKCKSCGKTFSRIGAPFCQCRLKWTTQQELYDFVHSIRPCAEFRNKSVLGNQREIDIYVPSLKIGFEYDGLYWHSELYGKNRNYHLNKTEDAAKKGVRLIHIFEDEWLLKKDITKDFIRAVLMDSRHFEVVFARKCVLKRLETSEAYQFFDENHILGHTNSNVNIGLVFDGRLVAAAAFKPMETADGSWYLERYASLLGVRVQGGCSRILSFFTVSNSPSKIRTFADKRWSVGGMYDKIGFTKVGENPPAYWYVKNGAPPRIHRFSLRKDNIKMFDKVYDPNMTEFQLASANGYMRIWDCGQIVYEIDFTK